MLVGDKGSNCVSLFIRFTRRLDIVICKSKGVGVTGVDESCADIL